MCLTNKQDSEDLTQSKKRSVARKKLWQLDSTLHCSVMGTCLSLEELRYFSAKLKIDELKSGTDYALHRFFVQAVKSNSYQTKYINKYLDRKYQSTIRKLVKAKSEIMLKTFWDEAVAQGDITAAYWALVTHPRTTDELDERVYGEVHMLSHLSGATVRSDRQELHQLQDLTRDMQKQLSEVNSELKRQVEEKNDVVKQLAAQVKKTQLAEQKHKQYEKRFNELQETNIEHLKHLLEESEIKLASQEKQKERIEANAIKWKSLALQSGDQYLELQKQHDQQIAERDILETAFQELVTQSSASCSGKVACQKNSNLCGRCILYVGGRSRQCANFRALVEQQNGQFLHHDGGLHSGRSRLGKLLPQADAVLCPLDCVSHDAAYKIKKYCKQNSKKLIWLPRSSLAAFMRGLTEVTT